MKTLADDLLVEEARRAALRFECDHCAYFEPSREACSHGYPVASHRPGAVALGKVIVFCKEFELGA